MIFMPIYDYHHLYALWFNSRSEKWGLNYTCLGHHTSPLTRDSHGSCVVIRVSRVHCTCKVSGLSRDTKYLNPRSRLWVIERDPYIQ